MGGSRLSPSLFRRVCFLFFFILRHVVRCFEMFDSFTTVAVAVVHVAFVVNRGVCREWRHLTRSSHVQWHIKLAIIFGTMSWLRARKSLFSFASSRLAFLMGTCVTSE